MPLDANLQSAFTRIGTEFKTVKTLLAGNNQADLASLSTTDKTSLLAAINELYTSIQELVAGGVIFRGSLSATADLTGNSTGNTYLDGGNEIRGGSLFKIAGTGNLTVSDGTVAVSNQDNIYIVDTKTDSTITIADIDVIDNTESITSVAGKIGAVTLDTDDLSEATNLFFTEARAISSLLTGFTSRAGSVSATDSVIQAIQKLNGNLVQLISDIGPTNTNYVTIFEAALT